MIVVPIGTIPENEAQIRPLMNLADNEAKYAVWEEVTKQSVETGERITHKKVQAHVNAYLESNPTVKTKSELKKIQRIEDKTKSNPIPADEQKRIDELKAGKTVVLNLHTDLHLLKYAMDNNLLVRCDGVSDWRNPFTVHVDGDYKEVYNLFKKMYLPHKKELLNRIPELKGKALGAYCYPEKCHCEVLKEWVEKGGAR